MASRPSYVVDGIDLEPAMEEAERVISRSPRKAVYEMAWDLAEAAVRAAYPQIRKALTDEPVEPEEWTEIAQRYAAEPADSPSLQEVRERLLTKGAEVIASREYQANCESMGYPANWSAESPEHRETWLAPARAHLECAFDAAFPNQIQPDSQGSEEGEQRG